MSAETELDQAPTHVAPHLLPTRSFDAACARVVVYLSQTAPMGMWAITRITDGRQIVLAIQDDRYGIGTGAEFSYDESLCRWMVAGTAPQIAPDVDAVPQYATAVARSRVPVNAYVGTPIVAPGGELYGTVCGFDPETMTPASMIEQPLLDLLSSLLSAVLQADLHATAVSRELEQARHEADVDALTGLLNRRGWDRFLEREEERFRRFGDPAGVVVLDLDHLKFVNDTLGHAAGDLYIQRAATALAGVIRRGDVLARLGGDEFGMVAVGAGTAQTAALIDRAERALARAGVAGSFGHAPYSVATGFPGACKAADEAMYEQKRLRRGRPGRHHRP